MKVKKSVSVFGAIALMLGVGMNLQYSLDDYGMRTNSLSTFALAQTNSSVEKMPLSGGPFWSLEKTDTPCTYQSTPTGVDISVSLPGGTSIGGSITGGGVITYVGVLWDCKDGWNPFCTKDCRAKE